MATKTIIKVFCDICKKEMSNIYKHDPQPLTVVFTTEQTEGRSVTPYLSTLKLDWCHDCEDTMLSGKMVFAQGAMGYNTYYFKE